jgi:glycosyltransferase involved in cell wall biosynthesis
VRTLQFLVESLGDEFEFSIVTRDRDLGDDVPYPGIQPETWVPVGKSRVFYIDVQRLTLGRMRQILRETPHDILYLNSLFAPPFTVQPLLLRWLRQVPSKAAILRPRGELNPGALALKPMKKKIHLAVTQALGFYRGIVWHASTQHEVDDVRRNFGPDVRVVVAPNLSMPVPPEAPRVKTAGHLRVVFISRVAKKKNLAVGLQALSQLTGQVEMNIYGPLEEDDYWAECQKIIAGLPPNIRVEYGGGVTPERVPGILREHHVFLFPTLGENFGHAIFEALAAGCPVIVSDRTPWRNLEAKQCGWDIPLEQEASFGLALQRCVEMDDGLFRVWSSAARQRALDYVRESEAAVQNRRLFASLSH